MKTNDIDWKTVFRNIESNDVIIDTDTTIIEATDSFLDITMRTREEIIGGKLFDVFPEQPIHSQKKSSTSILTIIEKSIETRSPQSTDILQYDIWSKELNNYETRFWTISVRPILNDDANLIKYIIYRAEDNTSQITQKRLEKALKVTEVFKLLVDNVKDYSIFLLDNDGYVRTWNEGAKRLNYYENEEIVGKHFSIFFTAEDKNRNKWESELKTSIKYGRTEDEYWRVRKDGSKFWGNVIITAVYNETKELIGEGVITRDLTERVLTEQKVLKAFETSAKLKSEFLANMSHEIRTPMNGVVSAATLLHYTPLQNDQKELVKIITESSETLGKVINDILDYSKMESNEMRLVMESFDISHEVEKVARNYRFIVNKKPIKIIVSIAETLTVIGDSFRFRQIITNLVDNAVKFTDNGSVTIKVTHSIVASFCMVKVEIIDTGIGIQEQDIGKLFVPFSQLDLSTKKRYKGTGLGLSICKNLVDIMKGEIGVFANKDKGCTFWFTIPFDVSVVDIVPIIQKENNEIEKAKNPNLEIMIAEDNMINQNIVRKILKKLGYEKSSIAADGMEAVELFKSKHFDLILMDIQMPIMDGYIATDKIRSFDKNIPIVAMTANALKEDEQRCLDAGMNDYVSKPVNFQKLARIINKWTSTAT